jgi:hypothetical protein
LERFLVATPIVDWQQNTIRSLARDLSASSPLETAKQCFAWVRDHIKHSSDHQLNPVTCAASEVLEHGTGYCYAKSHLLAALLRANQIPTGFCYQRLSIDGQGAPFCLHGLNAVHLADFGWYRIDARGNRHDIEAEFCPPVEKLAFAIQLPGERDLPEVFDAPLPVVIDALRAHATWDEMLVNLPDVDWQA